MSEEQTNMSLVTPEVATQIDDKLDLDQRHPHEEQIAAMAGVVRSVSPNNERIDEEKLGDELSRAMRNGEIKVSLFDDFMIDSDDVTNVGIVQTLKVESLEQLGGLILRMKQHGQTERANQIDDLTTQATTAHDAGAIIRAGAVVVPYTRHLKDEHTGAAVPQYQITSEALTEPVVGAVQKALKPNQSEN